jgi:hypothetical protein
MRHGTTRERYAGAHPACALADAISQRCGITIDDHTAAELRRAEMTLHRWAEDLCGGSNDMVAVITERDDDGHPWRVVRPNRGGEYKYRIPDRERGALRRVRAICNRLGLYYYHQSDPRGCALYVDSELIPSNDYTRAVACRR